MILSNRDLRRRIFEIFDQTFAVTYVLADDCGDRRDCGNCLTLTTLITERSRELGVLRAMGASVGQLRKLLLWESAMIGLLAAAVGLVSGICLSLVLTGVINRAFFGWTIQLAFPWGSLAVTPLWIVAAALLAGLLPAWRAGRLISRRRCVRNKRFARLRSRSAAWRRIGKSRSQAGVTNFRAIITRIRISKRSGGISPATLRMPRVGGLAIS